MSSQQSEALGPEPAPSSSSPSLRSPSSHNVSPEVVSQSVSPAAALRPPPVDVSPSSSIRLPFQTSSGGASSSGMQPSPDSTVQLSSETRNQFVGDDDFVDHWSYPVSPNIPFT